MIHRTEELIIQRVRTVGSAALTTSDKMDSTSTAAGTQTVASRCSELSDKFGDGILHRCPNGETNRLDARYLPDAQEYRTVCPECNGAVYGNRNGVEHV